MRTRILFLWSVIAMASVATAQQVQQAGDVPVTIAADVQWAFTNVPSSGSGANATLSCYALSATQPASCTVSVTRGASLPAVSTTNQLGTRFMPGVTYTVTLTCDNNFTPSTSSPNGAVGANIRFTAPPGYTIQAKLNSDVSFSPAEAVYGSFNPTAQTNSATIRVRVQAPLANSGLPAGLATSLSTDRTMWQLSLGTTLNGASAGMLTFENLTGSTTLAGIFTRTNLTCTASSSEVTQVPDTGNTAVLRQIVAPQVAVDITGSYSSGNIQINCYHRSQFSDWGDPTTGYFTITGTPYASYTVAPQGSDSAGIVITAAMLDIATNGTRSLTTSVTRNVTSTDTIWTAVKWHQAGAAAPVTEVRDRNGNIETITVQDANSAVAQKSIRTYAQMLLGEEIISLQAGTSSPVTTSYTYYTDLTQPSYGKIQLTTNTGGSWQGIAYDANGHIANTYAPFNNAPAAPASLPPASGVAGTVTYSLDAFNCYTRPATSSSQVTTSTTVTTGSSSTTYATETPFSAYTTHPRLTVVDATRVDNTDSSHTLTTLTKYFSEVVGIARASDNPQAVSSDDFLNGQPYSVQQPTGVKQSYAYQRGTWDGTTFTPSSNAGLDAIMPDGVTKATAGRIAVITGTAVIPPAGVTYSNLSTYAATPIDALNVIDGKSTLTVTIRDKFARPARMENYVWSAGSWVLLTWTNLYYNNANQLTNRSNSNGTSYSATYQYEQLKSEMSESGITTSYTYDAADRVVTVTKAGVTGVAGGYNATTTYVYDAASHVLSTTLSSTGTTETMVASQAYDDSGRVTSESKPGQGGTITTTYSYNPSANTVTVTLPNGGTRTQTNNLDGRTASESGTAAILTNYAYEVLSDGTTHSTMTVGSSGARSRQLWQDWAGRTTKTQHPAVGGTNQFVEQATYDSATGLLRKTHRSDSSGVQLLADSLYQYDVFGAVNRSGSDINGNGVLDLASNDRISDLNQYFEYNNSAWWATKQSIVYATANSGTPLVTSTQRTRLTGLGATYTGPGGASGVLAAERLSTDINGNTVDEVTVLNSGAATTTIVTTASGITAVATQKSINGLSVSATGFDGATYTTGYDALQRPATSTDPRTGSTVTSYYPGTTLISAIVDAAGITVATCSYDAAGRAIAATNANGKVHRTSYNTLDLVTNEWGDTAYPVQYGYDAYGARTSMTTFRGGSGWNGSSWPGTTGTGDTTTWTYDDPTGLLLSKADASNQAVSYTYNTRGQTASRVWARGITTTYGYDGNTGELLNVTYTDATPSVTYAYSRMGQIATVADATGTRTFNYGTASGSNLLQLDSIALPSFYNGPANAARVLTRKYDALHRGAGFSVGSELNQSYAFEGATGRFSSIQATSAVDSVGKTFTYSYNSQVSLIAGYTAAVTGSTANFTVARSYEAHRDLLTSINAQWSATVQTQYDYTYNNLAQRATMKQTGAVFGDYSGSGSVATIYNYGYNDRGEMNSAADYLSADGTSLSTQMSDRNFSYTYDNLGNRVKSSRNGSGDPSPDTYSVNALNQYTQKTNAYGRTTGTVSPNTTSVSVSAGGAGWGLARQGRYWAADTGLSTTPMVLGLTVKATIAGGGTNGADLVYTDTAHTAYLPPSIQQIQNDADGNMTTDGLWNYVYDAENRLVSMTATQAAQTAGFPAQSRSFQYDYLNRRVQKQLQTTVSGTTTTNYTRRYLYDGDNLVAEVDASTGGILRSYTWGLDLAGSLSASGGVGALLQITDHLTSTSYFPTYDGNGNIAALVNASSGAVAATYEYSPFGELLRCGGSYAKSNPFRFSTKLIDDETGLVYYGARYYSPSLGRFINRDPIAEAGGINLYGFCGNDGINRFDVLGHSWLSKLWNRTIGSLGKKIAINWDHGRQYVITAVAIVAAIVTYGAASEWAAAEMTDSIFSAAYATGTVADGMAAVAASSTEIGIVSGAVGGAAAGAVGGAVAVGLSGGNLSQVATASARGAVAGALTGAVQGFYGNTYPIDRVPATAVAGGIASKIQGGNFRQGFTLNGGIAAITYAALWMRTAMIENSMKDPRGYNVSGSSVGFNGDNYKIGGGRFDPNFPLYAPDGVHINAAQISPLGGFQGGEGSFLGRPYAAGSFFDRVVESFSGPHDWLNSWWGYAASDGVAANGTPYYVGDYVPGAAVFGKFFGAYAGRAANIANWIDVPLASPFAIGANLGIRSGALSALWSRTP
jgi:RHS repeat-associated protein